MVVVLVVPASVTDPDSGMFIPDPGSRIRLFPSRIQGWQDPGSEPVSKSLSIFNPKN
jgi:hypothetical protein